MYRKTVNTATKDKNICNKKKQNYASYPLKTGLNLNISGGSLVGFKVIVQVFVICFSYISNCW